VRRSKDHVRNTIMSAKNGHTAIPDNWDHRR
jgi:hypothetical protein